MIQNYFLEARSWRYWLFCLLIIWVLFALMLHIFYDSFHAGVFLLYLVFLTVTAFYILASRYVSGDSHYPWVHKGLARSVEKVAGK